MPIPSRVDNAEMATKFVGDYKFQPIGNLRSKRFYPSQQRIFKFFTLIYNGNHTNKQFALKMRFQNHRSLLNLSNHIFHLCTFRVQNDLYFH